MFASFVCGFMQTGGSVHLGGEAVACIGIFALGLYTHSMGWLNRKTKVGVAAEM